MKHLMILTVGICFLVPSAPATADQAEDEAAIHAAMEKREAAFNRRK